MFRKSFCNCTSAKTQHLRLARHPESSVIRADATELLSPIIS